MVRKEAGDEPVDEFERLYLESIKAADEGRLEEAVSLMQRAVEIDPAPPMVMILADQLLDLGRLSEALSAAERGRKLYATAEWCDGHTEDKQAQSLAGTLRLLGRIHEAAGRLRDAEANYRESVSVFPVSSGFIYLGVLLGETGRHAEEREAYENAIEVDPEDDEAHYNLGSWHIEFGDPALARKHLERAIEIDPEYEIALQALAELE